MPHDSRPSAEMLRRFGVAQLRPGQQAACDAIAAGRDVLVVLPTGGGKSLCYQLPAACGAAPAIVVSPLVALMKDQVDALTRRGVCAGQLSGAATATERDRAWSLLEDGALTLLYLAPEALASKATLRRLARVVPRLLAVDEAHCISEWGESFRPSYLGLGTVRRALGDPPTVALTATATPRTAREIVDRLALRDPVIVSGGFDRANLRLWVRPVTSEAERLTGILALGQGAAGPAIVYANSRRDTERLAGAYVRRGVAAAAFHAGLPTVERAGVQERFQANRLSIIVATNAFGMGVDKPDVRLVVHAAPPLTLEAYYQEAGRGGRDGNVADCVLLHGPNDLARARAQIHADRVSSQLLAGLVAILADGESLRRVGAQVPEALRRLGLALSAAPRDVAAALRLLVEAGALAPSEGMGELRLLATGTRLEHDRSLDGADVAALRAFLALRADRSAVDQPVHSRELRELAPDRDATRWLQRLAARQVAVWQPLSAPWRLAHRPSDELLAALAARHTLRQERNLWRHGQVARMVVEARCRRLVLLRYFGDVGPRGPCGACDVCGTSRDLPPPWVVSRRVP